MSILADEAQQIVEALEGKEELKSENVKMNNEQKAKFMADQLRPCTSEFYSGFYQGVLIALNASSSTTIQPDMRNDDIKTKMLKDLSAKELEDDVNRNKI